MSTVQKWIREENLEAFFAAFLFLGLIVGLRVPVSDAVGGEITPGNLLLLASGLCILDFLSQVFLQQAGFAGKGGAWTLLPAMVVLLAFGTIARSAPVWLICLFLLAGLAAAKLCAARPVPALAVSLVFLLQQVLMLVFPGLIRGFGRVSRPAFVLALFLAAAAAGRLLHGKKWMQLPALSLLFLLLLFLPTRREPIRYMALVERARTMSEGVMDAVREVRLFLQENGIGTVYTGAYGGDGSMGVPGTATGNETDLVLTYPGKAYGVNLCGARQTLFREGRWTERVSERDLSAMNLIAALCQSGLPLEEAAPLLRGDSLQVTYEDLRTHELLLPYACLAAEERGRTRLSEDGLSFRRTGKRGDTYRVRLLRADLGAPAMQEVLRSGKKEAPSYDELKEYARSLLGISLTQILSREDYAAWAEAYENGPGEVYLDGAGVTERIRDLALSLTEGEESTYGKCLRIQAYLRSLPYARTYVLSGREDLADAFLFETKTGFCVHFATAMTVMLRSIGIPARYCEGYTSAGNGVIRREKETVLLGNAAHAWPEAWIPGIGWLPFEPTPVVAVYAVRTGEEDALASAGTAGPERKETPVQASQTEAEVTEEEKEPLPVGRFFAAGLLYLAGILAAALVFRRLSLRRLHGEALLAEGIRTVSFLLEKLAGAGTLLEQARRLDRETGEAVQAAVLAYYGVRYGGHRDANEAAELVLGAGALLKKCWLEEAEGARRAGRQLVLSWFA